MKKGTGAETKVKGGQSMSLSGNKVPVTETSLADSVARFSKKKGKQEKGEEEKGKNENIDTESNLGFR